jgi:hypothetical protein
MGLYIYGFLPKAIMPIADVFISGGRRVRRRIDDVEVEARKSGKGVTAGTWGAGALLMGFGISLLHNLG